MNKFLFILGGFAAGLFLMVYFSDDHQRYLAWYAQKEAWHRRCDVYVGKSPAELGEHLQEAEACKDEINAMIAYATRQGWQQH